MVGKLYMLPCPISENGIDTLPLRTIQALHALDHFIVERARTARRFIKATEHPKAIDSLSIFELNKENPGEPELFEFLGKLKQGQSIGVISEAGCPGIADPGALMTSWAHKNKIQVIPLTGPSSIFLALMASGMNGQSFQFHGYLPSKTHEMSRRLKQLEQTASQSKTAQIFMEAPYRNKNILAEALKSLNAKTRLCIACDIHDSNEYIVTKTIHEWKNSKLPELHKKPTIFIIG